MFEKTKIVTPENQDRKFGQLVKHLSFRRMGVEWKESVRIHYDENGNFVIKYKEV